MMKMNHIRYVYNNDLIIKYMDGTFTAFGEDVDGDIQTFETHSLLKAQEWLDRFNNNRNV